MMIIVLHLCCKWEHNEKKNKAKQKYKSSAHHVDPSLNIIHSKSQAAFTIKNNITIRKEEGKIHNE